MGNKGSLYDELAAAGHWVKRKELTAAAKVMASAFHDDPSIRYLLGGEKEGEADWKYFYCVLKAVYGKCIMLSTDEGLNDLLVLLPPRLKAVPTFSFLQKGGIFLSRFFGPGLFIRSFRYERNCRIIKSRFLTPRSWYCMCFAVSPGMQGRGLGSRLIKPVLDVFDRYDIPLYLETHKAGNVSMYTHLGFTAVDVTKIPATDITQYAMLKTP